jgi:hypothetical protein
MSKKSRLFMCIWLITLAICTWFCANNILHENQSWSEVALLVYAPIMTILFGLVWRRACTSQEEALKLGEFKRFIQSVYRGCDHWPNVHRLLAGYAIDVKIAQSELTKLQQGGLNAIEVESNTDNAGIRLATHLKKREVELRYRIGAFNTFFEMVLQFADILEQPNLWKSRDFTLFLPEEEETKAKAS